MKLHRIAGSLVLAGVALSASSAHAARYFIESPMSYEGKSCCATCPDLPDTTDDLRVSLVGNGWTGIHYVTSSKPQDFIDPLVGQSDGVDYSRADSAELTIFDGHGNSALLGWGTPHAGQCVAGGTSTPHNGIALGSYSGKTAGNLVTLTCCFLHRKTIAALADISVNQTFGFLGESSMDSGQVDGFYQDSAVESNVAAWFDNLEDCPGWFTGSNDPGVYTRGWNDTDTATNSLTCSLGKGSCISNRGYPTGGRWRLNYIENNSCADQACNGGC
jgi:hypothetical protein